jgi:Flp pilus assembly pilin Flp
MMKQIWLDERGASTAEYAIITLAAVGFAGLLLTILRSPEVRQILMDLIKSALTVNGTG